MLYISVLPFHVFIFDFNHQQQIFHIKKKIKYFNLKNSTLCTKKLLKRDYNFTSQILFYIMSDTMYGEWKHKKN